MKEQQRLETVCRCQVKHLPHVGAFILSYDSKDHIPLESLELDNDKVFGVMDEVVTISTDNVEVIPNDAYFSYQWPLANLENDADINAQEGWDEYRSMNIGSKAKHKHRHRSITPRGVLNHVILAVIDTGVDY